MFFKLFFIALPIFLALDMAWLGFIARDYYRSQIGSLLKDQVNWVAALVFYAIYISGLVTFVLLPAVTKHSWQSALLMGAFFGFVAYATYDLTNLAVAKNWTLSVTIVDLAWGTVVAGTVSVLTYWIAARMG
ncbi:DUF2177 family protein [Candidatus Peribacteria bacterium]|nr:DUF2177 family protein [Candidatus Peribacteria bacterium]